MLEILTPVQENNTHGNMKSYFAFDDVNKFLMMYK